MNSDEDTRTILETTYQAATNRMLRVAVNGFMESLGVVLGVMEELDIDVLGNELRRWDDVFLVGIIEMITREFSEPPDIRDAEVHQTFHTTRICYFLVS